MTTPAPARRSARLSKAYESTTPIKGDVNEYSSQTQENSTSITVIKSVRVRVRGNIILDEVSPLSGDEASSKKKNNSTVAKSSSRTRNIRRVVTPSLKDSSNVSISEQKPRRNSTRKRNIIETKTPEPKPKPKSKPRRKNQKKRKNEDNTSAEINQSSLSGKISQEDDDSDVKSYGSSCSSYKEDIDEDHMSDHLLEIEYDSDSVKKEASRPKKKGGRRSNVNDNNSNNDDNNEIEDVNVARQPLENDEVVQPAPYKVTYAKSGRATCKRCDELILKGEPRTTHRPLFRGKPGFEVHRHLACTVFNVDVKTVDDVAEHKDLRKADYDVLLQRIIASQEEIKKEMEELHPDELTPVAYSGPIRNSPEGLTASLLPFQKEGVSWMYEQEVSSPIKGGILADEMGMGKTLQSIFLILDHMSKLQLAPPNVKHPPNLSVDETVILEKEETEWEEAKGVWNQELNTNSGKDPLYNTKKKKNQFPLRGGTLVICPVIALYQWKSEIEKFTSNKLKVCIYHGPNRQQEYTSATLATYDIVLSTYNVIEIDYRKMVISTQKVPCPNCGKKYKLDKLHVHLKYFCGDGAQKTEAQAKQRRKKDREGDDDEKKKGEDSKKMGTKKKTFDTKEDSDSENEEEFEPSKKKRNGKKQMKKGMLKKSVSGKKKTFNEADDYKDSDSDASHFLPDNKVDNDDIKQLIKQHQQKNPSSPSVLHGIIWWRIVLDEAHYIKSRSSQTSASAFALISIYRWCLSGTPLQNRVGEFYSLIRFLRINPMGYYFCRKKGCDCNSLHYNMFMGKCTSCDHSSIQHYSYFNKHVLNPIQRDGYQGDGRRAVFLLKNSVLDKCLLRRTKSSHAEDLNLPPRCVSIQFVKLHPIEEDFYNALYTQTRSSFNDYVADGTLLNNYAHIFDLLVRMRQAVCHPYLVVFGKRKLMANMTSSYHPQSLSQGAAEDALVANGSTDCDICHEVPTDRILSTCCKSAFCKSCVMEYMTTSAGLSSSNGNNSIPCPSCQSPFSIDLNQSHEDNPASLTSNPSVTIKPEADPSFDDNIPSLKQLKHIRSDSILRRIDLAQFTTSTKIEALMSNLVTMRTTSPASKAIVFSQFTNMLDIIRWRIYSDEYLTDELGLNVVQVHGGLNVNIRNKNLNAFQNDPHIRVLLISLKAGGVALNLTRANYIYLMDPWWNPAAEMQAIDRTHRLGQYRPIRAVRFIAENTVEERILQLQEKKQLVFDGTVGRDAGSLTALSVDDMKCLFT